MVSECGVIFLWCRWTAGLAGRGLAVAEEKGEDVVLAVVARLGDEAQVGRVRAVVGVPGTLRRFLCVWGLEVERGGGGGGRSKRREGGERGRGISRSLE